MKSNAPSSGFRRYTELLGYALPYKRFVSIQLLCMGCTVALGLLKPWPLKIVVDNVLGGDPLKLAARLLRFLILSATTPEDPSSPWSFHIRNPKDVYRQRAALENIHSLKLCQFRKYRTIILEGFPLYSPRAYIVSFAYGCFLCYI